MRGARILESFVRLLIMVDSFALTFNLEYPIEHTWLLSVRQKLNNALLRCTYFSRVVARLYACTFLKISVQYNYDSR